jgi:hypothetical protein
MKFSLCVLALAAVAVAAAHASASTVPGLVYTAGYGNSIVTSYDPETLARSGPRLRLGGNANSWSWSPQRRYLAVASYPQRLTLIDARSLRVVARVRLAAGGGVARAVTWLSRARVAALIDTPRGVLLSVVDTAAGRVVARALIPGTVALEFDRVPGGLVFLAGARSRMAPVRLATVDAEGLVRTTTIAQVPAGLAVRPSGDRVQQDPGLAVDPRARKAYVAAGDRIFMVDLRRLTVSDPGPLRTLAKVSSGSTRTAEWLGNGLIAVSGWNWDRQSGNTPAGLRIVEARSWTARVVDRAASSFTWSGGRLLVERRASGRALGVTAYGLEGRELYRIELAGANWLKKHGRLGYACRQAFLRSVIDLADGRTIRTGFAAETRCPTLLTDDSRG